MNNSKIYFGVFSFVLVFSAIFVLHKKNDLDRRKAEIKIELTSINQDIKENKKMLDEYASLKERDDKVLQHIKTKHNDNVANNEKAGKKLSEIEREERQLALYTFLLLCCSIAFNYIKY